jgi:oligopeptide/dipeptide ABC transporter ATP-binding protein
MSALAGRLVAAQPKLEVEHLTVEFATRGALGGLVGRPASLVRAVDDVSFAIARGETLGLVGESGSGKTTVGRALLGLNRPSAGRMLLDGQDIAALPRRERSALPRRMQMVFQDPYGSLNPRFSVERTLAEVLSFHAVVPRADIGREVRRLMGLVGLSPSLADRLPRHLSGGQRQRVGIARALAVRPSVLVLDEPVAALDVSIQAQVLNLLQELRSTLGLTMLFIAHELGVVRYVSDQVAVMYRGAILETGTSSEIFSGPRHPYTQSLLAAAPRLVPQKRLRPPVLSTESSSGAESGCRFRTRCPRAAALCAMPPPTAELSPTHRVACHFATTT